MYHYHYNMMCLMRVERVVGVWPPAEVKTSWDLRVHYRRRHNILTLLRPAVCMRHKFKDNKLLISTLFMAQ